MKELVWDLFVRVFHWSLAVSFTLAYLAAEYGYDEVHEWLGYFIALLVVSRIVWGFIGSKYARFSSFIYPISDKLKHFKAILKNDHQDHHMGHTPLGGAMVFALLFGLVGLVFSGLILLGWSEYTGPVWAMDIAIPEGLGDLMKDVHYLLPEVMLFLVGAHILGVIVAVKQHGENLVHSMFHGHKNKPH
ncbi:MAG: cytochrome b/b6 domain-containing protein [Ghiorsea sp.]